MINRERLLEIEDLKIAKRLLTMGKQALDDYAQDLNDFIDDYPRIEAEMREALGKKDAESLSEKMLALRDDLIKIGADDIAAECGRYVNNFSIEKIVKFEAYVNFLLSQLAALSIDIQMVIFKDGRPERIVRVAETPPADTKPPAQSAAEKPPVKVILAVDDDPQCLDLFKMALKEVPCKIIAVTSGMAALSILQKQTPDLFVFDIDMPIINGLELANKVQEIGCHVPIVFITGNSQKETVVKALMAGGQDFIIKPINPQNVVGRITKFI